MSYKYRVEISRGYNDRAIIMESDDLRLLYNTARDECRWRWYRYDCVELAHIYNQQTGELLVTVGRSVLHPFVPAPPARKARLEYQFKHRWELAHR